MSDLSGYLKKQYAAQQEQALAQLKGAYDKNVQRIDESAAALPQQYEAARNDAAAQSAIARKNFNEQAAATGLNSGTSGQAELARSSAYQSALAGLNTAQQNAQQALERDKLGLQAEYENAIAAQKAASQSALQQALYQEKLRQQSYGGGSGGGGVRSSVKYDTHGYSSDEIKALQQAAGITVDGIWGPDTQRAYEAGYRPGGTGGNNAGYSQSVNQQLQKAAGGSYYMSVADKLQNMKSAGSSNSEAAAYLRELLAESYITPSEYSTLYNKYRDNNL